MEGENYISYLLAWPYPSTLFGKVFCGVYLLTLFIRMSKHSSFSVDFNCSPGPSSESFVLPCNDGILLFSIFKALLVSFRCFPTFLSNFVIFHTNSAESENKMFTHFQ